MLPLLDAGRVKSTPNNVCEGIVSALTNGFEQSTANEPLTYIFPTSSASTNNSCWHRTPTTIDSGLSNCWVMELRRNAFRRRFPGLILPSLLRSDIVLNVGGRRIRKFWRIVRCTSEHVCVELSLSNSAFSISWAALAINFFFANTLAGLNVSVIRHTPLAGPLSPGQLPRVFFCIATHNRFEARSLPSSPKLPNRQYW